MISLVWLSWIIFAGLLLVVFALSYVFVHYYCDKYTFEFFPALIAALAMATLLLALMLIPVDIYSVSSHRPSHSPHHGKLPVNSQVIGILYDVLYGLVLVFAFVLIPFAYFYYEEKDADTTMRQRIWAGCKYTVFLVAIITVLLVVGIFVETVPSAANKNEYLHSLVKNESFVESSLAFALACVSCIGYLVWLTYAAYGFSSLPLGLIFGYRSANAEKTDIKSALEKTRDRVRSLGGRYAGRSGSRVRRSDQDRISLLQDEERQLEARQQQVDRASSGPMYYLFVAMYPIRLALGVAMLLIAVLFAVSLILTNIDRLANSISCGAKCGWIMKHPSIFNPLDKLMVFASKLFPADYVLFGLLISYIVCAVLNGVIVIGVRFLWIKMYAIRARQTHPQAMLVVSLLLIFALMALIMELPSLAPQYITFGSQHYYNAHNKSVPCEISANATQCEMTQLGAFTTRIQVKLGFFSVIFYWASWAFVAMLGLCFVWNLFFRRRYSLVGDDADPDDDDDFEPPPLRSRAPIH